MPKNAIVALIVRIEPSVEKLSADEAFRRHPDGFSIVFEGDQTARLYAGDRAAGILQILEGLRQLRTPAYVEVDPQTNGITHRFIPLVTTVTKIIESPPQDLRAELTASPPAPRLSRTAPTR